MTFIKWLCPKWCISIEGNDLEKYLRKLIDDDELSKFTMVIVIEIVRI